MSGTSGVPRATKRSVKSPTRGSRVRRKNPRRRNRALQRSRLTLESLLLKKWQSNLNKMLFWSYNSKLTTKNWLAKK
jgi:hypothetical protein